MSDSPGMRPFQAARGVCAGDLALGDQGREVGDLVVSFDERRQRAEARDGVFIELPRAIRDRRSVRIDEHGLPSCALFVFGLKAAEVEFRDRVNWKRIDIGVGVKAHVVRAQVHIADVAQQATAGPGHERTQEFRFRHH